MQIQDHPFALAALAALTLAIASGCTTRIAAPVVDRTARPVVVPQPQVPSPITETAVNPALPGNTSGSQFHVVQRGETLYGIARVNNIDINALAAWNNIAVAQPLRDGQVLRLQSPSGSEPGMPVGAATGAPSATLTPIPATGAIAGQPLPGSLAPVLPATPIIAVIEAPLKREPKSQRVPYSDAALAAMKQGETSIAAVAPPGSPSPSMSSTLSSPPGAAASAPPLPSVPSVPSVTSAPIEVEVKPGAGVDRDGISWTWPTSGKVASKFNDKAPMKGIDIAANAGTPVVAAAAGKVIYVGKEPRGYGQMIVVSHAKETVSVYFHTDKLLVKEQQRVLIGQKLAEVGDSAGNRLHFEVRRQGRPLDPVSLMPR